jgi:Tfp pilus assembly protein PilO
MMTTTTRRIAVIAAAAAVLAVVVWYLALYRPQSHALASAHRARAAAEQKIDQLHSQVAALRAEVKHIPSDTARLAILNAALPKSPSLDTALDQLHRTATAAGVVLSAVGPSAPAAATHAAGGSPSSPAGSNNPAITLNMSATGSYPQLMTFLRGLATMPRALVVDQLSLSGSSQLTASISARIFYTGSTTH